MSGDWGTIKGACPQCGGDIKYYEYGADCRGNPSSSGESCLEGCVLTEEQVQAFWSDLYARNQAAFKAQKARGEWDV